MTHTKTAWLAAGLFTATALASGTLPAQAANTTSLGHEVVMEGLEIPWDIAFLDDGTMFVTEICHGVSVRMPSGEVMPLLGPGGVDGFASTAEDLFCNGQAGLNGIAVDPNFAENRQIYIYSASNMSDPQTDHVIRFTLNEDFSGVSDRTDLIDSIPYKVGETDHPFGNPGAHNGGRLRFGPDGFLYVTTGDNHGGAIPQDPMGLGGKVLRITADGEAAPDNGAPEGFDPRIYTHGHRNPQGITFHPETGTPILAEHGPWHSDQITVLVPGGNGGWDPRDNMAGRPDCPDGYCGYEPNQMDGMNRCERATFMPMTDLATYPDAMVPIRDNNGSSQGITQAEFLTGDQRGDWDGAMAVGYMGIGFGDTPIGQRIDVFELGEDMSVVDVTEMTLPMDTGRFRVLVQDPDGSLYVAMDRGEVVRMTPGAM